MVLQPRRAEDGLAAQLLPKDLKGLFEVGIYNGARRKHPWVGRLDSVMARVLAASTLAGAASAQIQAGDILVADFSAGGASVDSSMSCPKPVFGRSSPSSARSRAREAMIPVGSRSNATAASDRGPECWHKQPWRALPDPVRSANRHLHPRGAQRLRGQRAGFTLGARAKASRWRRTGRSSSSNIAAGTSGWGLLVRVDTGNGARERVSDFGDSGKGGRGESYHSGS